MGSRHINGRVPGQGAPGVRRPEAATTAALVIELFALRATRPAGPFQDDRMDAIDGVDGAMEPRVRALVDALRERGLDFAPESSDSRTGVIGRRLTGVRPCGAPPVDVLVETIEHLAHALTSRGVIGQAQGILMERNGATEAEAFDVLRTASSHNNRKLRDVAVGLADTGVVDDEGTATAQRQV